MREGVPAATAGRLTAYPFADLVAAIRLVDFSCAGSPAPVSTAFGAVTYIRNTHTVLSIRRVAGMPCGPAHAAAPWRACSA